jgi:methyl-accepting chemotaxis protein
MTRRWTFGRKIAVSFVVMVALTLSVVGVAVLALTNVVTSKDHVIDVNQQALIDAKTLELDTERKSAAGRAFLLTANPTFLDRIKEARDAFDANLSALRTTLDTDEERRLLDAIKSAEADHREALDEVIALRSANPDVDVASAAFEDTVVPKRLTLDEGINEFVSAEEKIGADARKKSTDTANSAKTLVLVISGLTALAAAGLGFTLARSLRRQIGSAIGDVKSSSAELQATANQQATGVKEQATSMNEINTTINELLATSRQIAESAQRVAEVAEHTAGAGRTGQHTVTTANESMDGIRQQVDVIVHHMLELGEKSQEIGAVVDIVSELAEQTNILAINSTIEAAGAGEAGKRFAVVADEIRKLADAVAESTKEIRSLVDLVRSAVNTAVMATEIGSKAVDAGSAQFGEVTRSFEEISELMTVTTEAAREIELSTKQQTTAVEQVNVAIADVAVATRESEASSLQTAQTATQLTTLAGDLQRLVEPVANG